MTATYPILTTSILHFLSYTAAHQVHLVLTNACYKMYLGQCMAYFYDKKERKKVAAEAADNMRINKTVYSFN